MRQVLLLLALAALLMPACAGQRGGRYSAFPPTESHAYREVAGTALEVHVFRPAEGAAGGRRLRPAVLFFHGGSWTRGRPGRFFPHARALADRGMVALSAGYRLQGTHGTGVPEAIDDAKAAYAWLVEHAAELGVDRDRIVVGGGSAGGHLAAAVALMDPLPEVPPVAMVLYNPALDTHPDDIPSSVRWMAAPRLEALFQGRYRELSPAQYVRVGTPPSAVFHGTEDSLVPIHKARTFCARLLAVGSACTLHEYPGAEHGSFNYGWGRHYEDAVSKTAQFLGEIGLIP